MAPFVFLMYQPMRNHLRLPFPKTLTLGFAVSLLIALGFSALSGFRIYSPTTMMLYRFLGPLSLIVVSQLLIKEMRFKALFVTFLLVPFISGILLLSSYISHFITVPAPTYMLSSLVRLGITAAVYPLILLLWKEMGKQADKISDPLFWRYIWLVPMSLCVSEMFLLNNTYETHGVELFHMLGIIGIWGCSIATCWLVMFLANRFEQRIHLLDAQQRNEMLLASQAQQYRELAESIEIARAARHDLRHHLSTMKVMADAGEYDRLNNYLTDIMEHMPRQKRITVCENYTANIVLDHFITRADEEKIPLKLNFQLSHEPGISDSDLCVLLGNALENAMEAALQVPEEKRFVSASALEMDDRIYITVDNLFDGTLKRHQEELFLSRKRDFRAPGVGIASIRALAKKYSGELRITTEDDIFKLSILLRKK